MNHSNISKMLGNKLTGLDNFFKFLFDFLNIGVIFACLRLMSNFEVLTE